MRRPGTPGEIACAWTRLTFWSDDGSPQNAVPHPRGPIFEAALPIHRRAPEALLSFVRDFFPDHVADEAAERDRLAERLALLGNELGDRLIGILNEGLIQEAGGRVELVHLTIDNLLDDIGGVASRRLAAIDFALALDERGRDLVAGNADGIGSGNLERDIAHQLLEILATGGVILLSADFDEYAHLATSVDVGSDEPVAGHFDAL